MPPLNNGSGGLLLSLDGEPTFSFVDPDLIYGESGSTLVSYRFSTGVQTTLHDVHSCLPGITVHGTGIAGTSDDQRLLVYVGGAAQDADTTVYVWDRTLGCRWLNTQTGQAGGQWGPSGAYAGDSGYTIHNARMSKNGQWAKITVGGGAGPAGIYFWNIGTMTVIPCSVSSAPFCPGHFVMGFNLAIDHRGLTDGLNFGIRPMSNPNAVTQLISPELTPTEFQVDTHPSWNNVQPDDAEPFCTEVFRTDDRVDRAWDGEIICVQTQAPATVWRFAHHRSRVVAFGDQPRANVSQDGRFLMFISNWEQTLGTQSAADGGSIRDEVFIVQLASSATVPAVPAVPTLTLSAAKFSWTFGIGGGVVVGVHVKCGTVHGGPYPTVGTALVPATSLLANTFLTQPNTYFCVAQSFNAAGESSPSNEVQWVATVSVGVPRPLSSLTVGP